MVNPRKLLWLPSAVVGGALGLGWIVAGGLVSCDSTAKFHLPDRKFHELQVVSAFPAHIDGNKVVRVCGVPLEGEEELAPNGVEVTLNLISTALKKKSCETDNDQSIKEGELIDLTRVKTTQPSPTVGPANFNLHLDCPPVQHGKSASESCDSSDDIQGSAVRYARLADRCSAQEPSSWINVAVLVDHSGSTSGLVDEMTFLEEPHNEVSAGDLNKATSDPHKVRVQAAWSLIESLNADRDRVIAYSFGEKTGVRVACSDAAKCSGSGAKCLFNEQCPAGQACEEDPTGDGDKFPDLPLEGYVGEQGNAQQQCFGKSTTARRYIQLGLDRIRFGGEGRAPLWEALDTAYSFLTTSFADGGAGVGGARHIVILTDGPDTCTESEDFNFADLTPDTGKAAKCRFRCNESEITGFAEIRNKLDQLGEMRCAGGDKRGGLCSQDADCPSSFCHETWPVQVHVVQFQSPGYRAPDARLQEIACRSGGTFQFINTEERLKDANSYDSLTVAMMRVRNTLSGSWRAAFKAASMTDQVPPGQMTALAGWLKFRNPKFDSLESVYQNTDGYRFGYSVNADQRMLLRRACRDAADCNGKDECGTNHCNDAGLCNPLPAKGGLPCSGGATNRCCNGACQQGTCADVCK